MYFGVLSLAMMALAAVVAVVYHRCVSRTKRLLTAWQVFTVGAFLAVVVQYLPIIHTVNEVSVLSHRRFTTVVLSMFEALRVFALDGDIQRIQDGLANVANGDLQRLYTAFAAVTLLAAPIITAGAVLSFFRSVTSRIRYALSFRKPLFVMSKLNPQSVALARSIRQKEKGKATIVFTDVFFEDGEDGFELMCEAQEKDINAICLKQDITHLRFGRGWWRKATCFVIGDDESENLAQAITLTERLKKRRRTAIYVYATSVGSGYVMDSLEKGDLLIPPSLKQRLFRQLKQDVADGKESIDTLMELLDEGVYERRLYPLADGFSISRIDSVYTIVLDTFCRSDVFGLCNRTRNDKVISLLIVGMGEYGKQILKTALWYCQMDGYTLEINVIDNGKDKNGVTRDIEEVLRHECPEVVSRNGLKEDGDAQYDIRFFKNVDCFTSSLDDVFENKENAERLRRTLMAFVALGDDDKNIETAIQLRKLFDRLYGVDDAYYKDLRNTRKASCKEAAEKDAPQIYAVVYDDRKAQNLNINKDVTDDSYLVDYKETPYHVHFIGNLSSHYAYDTLLQTEETAWKAFMYHTQWASIERTIREALALPENAQLCQEMLAQEGKQSISEIEWDDSFLQGKGEEEYHAYLLGEMEKYMRFEYYRYSSVAKAVHKTLVEGPLFETQSRCRNGGVNPLCRCEGCEWKRKTEHMRWAAYVRVCGYRYRDKRADRAQEHHFLVPNEQLSWRTRFKD